MQGTAVWGELGASCPGFQKKLRRVMKVGGFVGICCSKFFVDNTARA